MKTTLVAMGAMALASGVSATPAAAASLLGDTISCTRNGAANCNPDMTTVGPGIEFTQGAATFNFDATGLTVNFTAGQNVSPLVYAFTDQTRAFTGFSNAVVTGGTFDTSRISLSSGVLSFNLGGTDPGGSARLRLDLMTGAVPEPATWAMMLVGFGMVAGAARYRRRRSNVAFA